MTSNELKETFSGATDESLRIMLAQDLRMARVMDSCWDRAICKESARDIRDEISRRAHETNKGN